MKTITTTALAIAAIALSTGPAHAVLQLSADINGTPFNCVDNTACDQNPLAGTLQIANQTIAGVAVERVDSGAADRQ